MRHPRLLRARRSARRRVAAAGGPSARRPRSLASRGPAPRAHRDRDLLGCVPASCRSSRRPAARPLRRSGARTTPCTRASTDRCCAPRPRAGWPALGCADSRAWARARCARSSRASPRARRLQFSADDVGAGDAPLATNGSGGDAVEAVAVLLGRHLGDDRQRARRCGRRRSPRRSRSGRGRSRGRTDRRRRRRAPRPARGSRPPPRRRRSCPTARFGRRAGRWPRRRTPDRARRCRASRAPSALILAHPGSAEPERAQLDPVRPERVALDHVGAGPHVVLVHPRPTTSGWVRFDSSNHRLMNTPRATNIVPIAPSHTRTRRSSSSRNGGFWAWLPAVGASHTSNVIAALSIASKPARDVETYGTGPPSRSCSENR